MLLRGTFIERRGRRLFCALRVPSEQSIYAVMVVPAFGDEMNKTRRMVTEVARRLNNSRIAVIIPDMVGTGDSEGSFEDASWSDWVDDLTTVYDWASGEQINVRGLVAIRTGALLAAQLSAVLPANSIDASVLWQPVRSGRVFVRQLLRVRTLANAINSGLRETVDELIARVIGGEHVLVGGYRLTAATVGRLMDLELNRLKCGGLGSLFAIEATRSEESSGDFAEQVGDTTLAGMRYVGEPYWSSTEIVCDQNVVARTAEFFHKRATGLA